MAGKPKKPVGVVGRVEIRGCQSAGVPLIGETLHIERPKTRPLTLTLRRDLNDLTRHFQELDDARRAGAERVGQ